MKHNHGYEINYGEKTIIVTKKFLKNASVIGSSAYDELAQLRKDIPDFKIVQREISKKDDKKTYNKLTYDAMAEIIKTAEGEKAAPVLIEFERIQELAKSKSGPYAYVKTWFLKRYKDRYIEIEVPEASV